MKRRFLSILMAALMLLSLLPATALAAVAETPDREAGYDDADLPDAPIKDGDVWTVNPENAQYALDGAYGSIDGKTIQFSAGTYNDVLVLARPTKYAGSNTLYYNMTWSQKTGWVRAEEPTAFEQFVENPSNITTYVRTVSNVTFTAEEGATIAGFSSSSGHVYQNNYDYVLEEVITSSDRSYYSGCSLKNITFQGLTISNGIEIDNYCQNCEAVNFGLTFRDCTFEGSEEQMATNGYVAIRMRADSEYFEDIQVENCTFENYFQGIFIQGTDSLTVTNCSIDHTTHNAIAVQSSNSNPIMGDIVITENVIQNANDRAIRFGNASNVDAITVNNNIMLDSGDDAGELIKAESFNSSAAISLEHNYWDGKTPQDTIPTSNLPVPTTIGVTGGTFSGLENIADYCASGYVPTQNPDGSFTVAYDDSGAFADGDGTEDNPYQIANETQLAAFRNAVNAGQTYAGKYIELTADIDLPSETNWEPIGNSSRDGNGYDGNSFQGVFDGKGNTISGLTISGTDTYAEDKAVGLFGVVAGGTVKDLTLTGVKIDCSDNELAGGVAGLLCNDGVISGCEVSGSVSILDGAGGIVGRMVVSGTVSGCVNNAAVTSTAGGAGGIVGKAYYTQQDKTMIIEDCINNGAVTNNAYHAGGISALSAANVTGCTNNGVITAGNTAGGIVAEQVNWGTVSDCANTAEIKGNNNAGGIIGWVRYQTDTTSYAKSDKISVLNNTNSGAITTVDGNTLASGLGWGGIVGTVYNSVLVSGNENTASSITGGTFGAGIVGNLQENNGNLYYNTLDIDVVNNVSTTPIGSITVSESCNNLYAYNNKEGAFIVEDNSTAWVAQIGEQKYATFQGAIEAAGEMTGNVTVEIIGQADVSGLIGDNGLIPAFDLSNSRLTSLTIQGADENVQIVSGVNGNGIDGDDPSTTETKENNYRCPVISIKLPAEATLTVENLTFPDDLLFDSEDGTVVVQNCVFNGAQSGYPQAKSISYLNNTFDFQGTAGNFYSGNAYPVWYKVDDAMEFVFTGNTVTGPRGVHIETRTTDADKLVNIQVDNNSFTLTDAGYENKTIALQLVNQLKGDISFSNNSVDAYMGVCFFDGVAVKDGAALTVENNYLVDDCKLYGSSEWNQNSIAAADEFAQDIVDEFAGKDGSTVTPGHTEHNYVNGVCTICDQAQPSTGGSSGATRYTVSVPSSVEGGKITVSPSRASRGSTVTVTVTPDEGYELDTLTVTDSDGNALTLTDKGDGKYTFTMPRGAVEIAASFKAVEEEPQPSGFPFTDVAENAWYYDAVVYAWENDLMTGTSAATFAPGMTTDRAMLATLLWRLEGSPSVDYLMGFDDVAEGLWYSEAVRWAASEGVVTGVGDGSSFAPTGAITREQMAVMLYRYAQYKDYDVTGSADLSGYADADSVSSWAQYAVAWAVDAGLISGVGNNTLNPQGSATRAEIATILMRFVETFVPAE